LDDLALRRHGLADAVHGVDVLRHGGSGGQPPANRRRETSRARALERRRQGTWESRHYTGWRALPRACRTLNARVRTRLGADWIQHRRAMLTARIQTWRIRRMSAPLKLSALLLALAVVALPASAAGRDNDRGHRGHDRHGQYDRHRGHD